MRVYIYLFVYICTCIYIVYMYICVYVHIFVYVCVYVYIYIYIYIRGYMIIYIFLYLCIYVDRNSNVIYSYIYLPNELSVCHWSGRPGFNPRSSNTIDCKKSSPCHLAYHSAL